MFEASELVAFGAAVMVLVLVPGPNTMIILAQSLGGRRSIGLATVAGIELGTVVHTLAAALGLSVLLATSPLALTVVKVAGVAYLMVIGVRTMLQPPLAVTGNGAVPIGLAFRRALVTNVLNPKVALFFLAFIPQFVHPERGKLFLQFLILGGIVSLAGLVFGSLLALTAGSLAEWMAKSGAVARWQGRVAGSVLVLVAFWLLLYAPR